MSVSIAPRWSKCRKNERSAVTTVGADLVSLALYEPGDVAGGNLMKVWNLSRKTLRQKRAYDRRLAHNRRLG